MTKITLDLGQLDAPELVHLAAMLEFTALSDKAPGMAEAIGQALVRQAEGERVTTLELPEDRGGQELFQLTAWAVSWAEMARRDPVLNEGIQPFMGQLARELYQPFIRMVADNYVSGRLVEGLPASRREALKHAKEVWQRVTRGARRQYQRTQAGGTWAQ
jgi:hypothetical protein